MQLQKVSHPQSPNIQKPIKKQELQATLSHLAKDLNLAKSLNKFIKKFAQKLKQRASAESFEYKALDLSYASSLSWPKYRELGQSYLAKYRENRLTKHKVDTELSSCFIGAKEVLSKSDSSTDLTSHLSSLLHVVTLSARSLSLDQVSQRIATDIYQLNQGAANIILRQNGFESYSDLIVTLNRAEAGLKKASGLFGLKKIFRKSADITYLEDQIARMESIKGECKLTNFSSNNLDELEAVNVDPRKCVKEISGLIKVLIDSQIKELLSSRHSARIINADTQGSNYCIESDCLLENIEVLKKILKEGIFYPALSSMDLSNYGSYSAKQAEQIIDQMLGSGLKSATPEIRDDFNFLPYQFQSLVHSVLGQDLADPLPQLAITLSMAIEGKQKLEMSQAVREILKYLEQDNRYIQFENSGLSVDFYDYPDYSIGQSLRVIINDTNLSELPMPIWQAVRDNSRSPSLISSLTGNPDFSSIQQCLIETDSSIGQVLKNKLLTSQAGLSDTVELGTKLIGVADVSLFPFQLINAFREPGVSGGGPFRDGKDELSIFRMAKSLSVSDLEKIELLQIPALITAINLLRTCGKDLLFPHKRETNSQEPNPDHIAFQSCLEKISQFYLANGSEAEQFFVLGLVSNIRKDLEPQTSQLISDIIQNKQDSVVFSEALRCASSRVSYAGSFSQNISQVIIIEIAKNAYISTDLKKNAAQHFFNLGENELNNKDLQASLEKIFNKPSSQFLKAHQLRLEMAGEGIKDSVGVPSSYESESNLNKFLAASEIQGLLPAIRQLSHYGYKFNWEDLGAMPQMLKNLDSLCVQLAKLNSDLMLIHPAQSLPIEYRPRYYMHNDESAESPIKVFDINPYRSDEAVRAISAKDAGISFVERIQQVYGTIPKEYVETTLFAFKRYYGPAPEENFVKRFEQDLMSILRLRKSTDSLSSSRLLDLAMSSQVQVYLASEHGSLETVRIFSDLEAKNCSPRSLKISAYLFEKLLARGVNRGLSNEQIENITRLALKFLDNPEFVQNVNEEGQSTNPLIVEKYDAALEGLLKVCINSGNLNSIESMLDHNRVSTMAALKILKQLKNEVVKDFCEPENFRLLTNALPEHRNLDNLIKEGFSLFLQCGWLKVENLGVFSESLPEMLRRNASTADALSSYQAILNYGHADFLSSSDFSLKKELQHLIEFNSHFPGMRLPYIYKIFRAIDDASKSEWLKAVGLRSQGAAAIREIKNRIISLTDLLIDQEDDFVLNTEIDKELLVAIIGYAGSQYPVINAYDNFKCSSQQGLVAPLSEGFAAARMSVDNIDIEKLQLFSFSKPSKERYQILVADLFDIKGRTLKDVVNTELIRVRDLAESRISYLKSGSRQEGQTDLLQASKGKEQEISALERAIESLVESESIAGTIKALCDYKQKDNPICTPSLRRILLRMAVDQLSAEDNLYSLLGSEISKDAMEAIISLVRTNLKEEALPAFKLDNKQLKLCMSALSVAAFDEELPRLMSIETKGKEEILALPSRGILAELSGYNCDACWTRETDIMRNYPNVTAIMFIRSPDDKSRRRLVGACMLIECKDLEGNSVMVVRGLNPTQNYITQLDPGSFVENFIDSVLLPIAKNRGIDKIVVPGGSSGGSQTNRPTINHYINTKYKDSDIVRLDRNGPSSTFNQYDIADSCILLRDIRKTV